MKIVIVGGGIAGLGLAYELKKHNAEIVVLEQHTCGQQTTWAAAGMLAPMVEIDFHEVELLKAGKESLKRYVEWEKKLGNIGINRTGTIELAITTQDIPYLQRLYEFQISQNLNVQWLSGDDIRAKEPAIAAQIPAGIYAPNDIQIDNRLLIKTLWQKCVDVGIAVHEHQKVLHFEALERGIRVYAAHETFDCDKLVLATGADPNPALCPQAKIYPVKGQMLSVGWEDGVSLKHTIRIQSRTHGFSYIVPKAERIILGSTSEEMGFNRQVTVGGVFDIIRKCYSVMPALYDLPILETWAGLRPSTLDRMPILDKLPEQEIYAFNGLFRHGILLAPYLSHLLAEWLATGNPPEQIKPFTKQNRTIV